MITLPLDDKRKFVEWEHKVIIMQLWNAVKHLLFDLQRMLLKGVTITKRLLLGCCLIGTRNVVWFLQWYQASWLSEEIRTSSVRNASTIFTK